LRLELLHRWDLEPNAAASLQQQLRHCIIRRDALGPVRLVAGVDSSYSRNGTGKAAAVVLSFPELHLIDRATATRDVRFPYIPGLLSFREAPVILDALKELRNPPDLLICDGHGWAHPRRFGIACHLGLLTGLPAIGVAKTLLTGQHEDLPAERGSWVPIIDQGELIGAAVRTSTRVKPVYLSVGHRISLATAVDFVLRCAPRYRLPETTRRAHHLAAQGTESPGSKRAKSQAARFV
jgi:deoxyribonuclease V